MQAQVFRQLDGRRAHRPRSRVDQHRLPRLKGCGLGQELRRGQKH